MTKKIVVALLAASVLTVVPTVMPTATLLGEGTLIATVSAQDDGVSCEGTSCAHAAAVGGLHYTDLQSALNAAQSGEVTLLKDITVTGVVTIPNGVTLNLNNHKIFGNSCAAIIVNDGSTAFVKNGTLASTNKLTVAVNGGNLTLTNCTVTTENIDRAIQTNSNGTQNKAVLTLDNCKVTSSGDGIDDFGAGNTVTLRNGTVINCNAGWAVYHNGSNAGFKLTANDTTLTCTDKTKGYSGVYVSASTSSSDRDGRNVISFTNCTITGPTGIESKYTDVTLTNCDITATVPMDFSQNNNGSTALGFAVVSTDNSMSPSIPKPDATIVINGGNYKGAVGLSQLDGVGDKPDFAEATYIVNGGRFTTDPSDYLSDNVEAVVAYSDSSFGVYNDIQDAVDSARSGETVTVYKSGLTVEVDENSGIKFESAEGVTLPTMVPPSEPEEEIYIPSTPIEDGIHKYSMGTMLYVDGKRVKGLYEYEGATYYFNDQGFMQTGWIEMENGWRYFGEDGQMVTGWLQLGNVWYYLDPATGLMLNDGLATVGKSTYYFYDWGGMASDWWYEAEDGGWYFFGGSGAMKTAQWLEWKGDWYYLTESGQMAADTTIGGYYVDANGIYRA